jgi:hypothetical protein
MNGELQGGWGFVWAAYIVVWGGLAVYGLSLVRRYFAPSTSPLPPMNGDDGEENET